jgi:hypothetical protein
LGSTSGTTLGLGHGRDKNFLEKKPIGKLKGKSAIHMMEEDEVIFDQFEDETEKAEWTTKKGCFNCSHFAKCPHIASEKRKHRDFTEIFTDEEEPYVYGCSCTDYDTKEKVQFT